MSAYTLLENNRWKIERSTPRKNLPCHRMDGRFAWAIDSNTKHSPPPRRGGRAHPSIPYENYEKHDAKRKRRYSLHVLAAYGSNLCEGKT
jgi:hypothetical protein